MNHDVEGVFLCETEPGVAGLRGAPRRSALHGMLGECKYVGRAPRAAVGRPGDRGRFCENQLVFNGENGE